MIEPGISCSVIELLRLEEIIDMGGNKIKLPDPGPLPTKVNVGPNVAELDWIKMTIKLVTHKGKWEERSFVYKDSTLFFDQVKLC